VAEQLALQQVTGQRRAVQRDERFVRAWALLMNVPGHHLFAAPTFTEKQNGCIARGRATREPQRLLHGL